MSDIDSPSVIAPPKAKKMRRSFTVEKKLEIVKYAEDNKSKKGAATKFGVDPASVRDWTKQKKKLQAVIHVFY